MSTPAAGYSGTPLVRKLGIKPSARLTLIGAPDDFDSVLGQLPDGVKVRRRAGGSFGVAVAFCIRRSVLARRLPGLRGALDPSGGLWIAWPKKASKLPTDMSDNVVREVALPTGLVDNKVAAIDPTGTCSTPSPNLATEARWL